MTAFVGETRTFAFTFEPEGWARCQGQLLPIADYEALFQLIGITYGGDGETTFALPAASGPVSSGEVPVPRYICLLGLVPRP